MLRELWEPISSHVTAIGFAIDIVGILIILIENFSPKATNLINEWLSKISYMGFTERLERPILCTINATYMYLFIPAFIYFVIGSFYDFEMIKSIIEDKWNFLEVLLKFFGFFFGYLLVSLVFIWWIIPLLYVFSSKFIYKNKPLSGVGFMLIIFGIVLNLPQIFNGTPI